MPGGEPTHHPLLPLRPVGCVPLLPRHPGPNERLLSHQHVAAHHHRDGPDLLLPGAGVVHGLGGVEVSGLGD